MEKKPGRKYTFEEENGEVHKVSEPEISYYTSVKMKSSSPLTEEELKNSISGDELIESAFKFIDELFDRDEL